MKTSLVEIELEVKVSGSQCLVLAEVEFTPSSPAIIANRREDCEPGVPAFCTVTKVTPLEKYAGTDAQLAAAAQDEADSCIEVIEARVFNLGSGFSARFA